MNTGIDIFTSGATLENTAFDGHSVNKIGLKLQK